MKFAETDSKGRPLKGRYPIDAQGRWHHPDRKHVICGSTKKDTRINRYGDHICLRPPEKGRDCCKFHGGRTKRGAESHLFQDKGRGQFMPDALAERYGAALNNSELMDLRRDVALHEAMLEEELRLMKEGPDAASVWDKMSGYLDQFGTAMTAADVPRMNRLYRSMRRLTDARVRYHAARRDVREALGHKQRAVEAQVRIEHQNETTVTSAEFMAVIATIAQLVNAVFTNATERSEFGLRLDQILRLPNPEYSSESALEPPSTD